MNDQLTAALADRYRIERELGAGGMATVYLAEDLKHRRRVAVKVLRPDLAASLGRERFFREIEVAARLQHPHILSLFDSGEADGFLYYVMPYVEGASLRDRLAQGGEVPVNEVVRILAEIADALAYAHKHGVVHRDIKPDNVMLSGRHALVMDFGIAKAVSEATGASNLTSRGVALGTPAYMAPEQALAEGAIDQRTDIYALGVVAYELLTGRPPFIGTSSQQVLAANVAQIPDDVTRRRTTCPRLLADVVMRCLQKRAEDRWQSAEEIGQQLDGLMTANDGPPLSTTTPMVGRWWSRWSATASALLVLGLVGVGWQWWPRRDPRALTVEDLSHRIAVLPFENLGDSSRQYFANGVTEAITAQLTSIGDLGVTPRASAARYGGTTKSLGQVARELGVGYVLTGTVQWDDAPGRGPRVRVSPELVRVSDTNSVWAHGYDTVLTDVFGVYSDISTEVARALTVVIKGDEQTALTRRPTQNAEAYDLYLRGVDLSNQGIAEENLDRAILNLQRAVALDPGFALAWGCLAEQLSLAHWLYYRHDDATMAQATTAAETALRLHPDLPEAHRAMGTVWYRKRDYGKALAEFAIAQRTQPHRADLLASMGFVERRQGKWDQAIEHLRRTRDLDPGSAQSLSQLGETFGVVHRYAEAATQFRRAMEIDPDQPDAYYFQMIALLSERGDTAGARALVREGTTHFPPAAMMAGLGRPFAFVVAPDDTLSHAFEHSLATDLGGAVAERYLFRADLRRLRGDTAGARILYDSIRAILIHRLRGMPDDYGYRGQLALANAHLGRASEAIREGQRSLALLPPEQDAYFGVENQVRMATVYAILGQADPAVAHLRSALSRPTVVSRPYLRVDPDFDPIRNAPAFMAFMAESP